MTPVLRVEELRTHFGVTEGLARAVDGVSFSIDRGKVLGLVGESGCGKSVTALSVLKLVPTPPGRYAGGRILLDGRDILGLPEVEMRNVRGKLVSMIFQEPMTSLNPVFTIGRQIAEAIRIHSPVSRRRARELAADYLAKVGIPEPARRLAEYPHQLSGGMRQRVMIAMALCLRPLLLIADEPTTALDVTVQAGILKLMKDLQEETGTAVLLITHDLGIVAEMADDVAVMYAGKIVESAPVARLYAEYRHPYTEGLLASLPGRAKRGEKLHAIAGTVPRAVLFPPGCRFHTRCPFAKEICREKEPPLVTAGERHLCACWVRAGDGNA